jgi:hypothetical protein
MVYCRPLLANPTGQPKLISLQAYENDLAEKLFFVALLAMNNKR